MLLHLPQEVILVIARHLKFEDRLNLVLTCRVLKRLIASTLLYEELSFYRRQDALLSALEYFESRPVYISQVRRINTGRLFVTDEGLRRIPIAFPKVSEFTARGIVSQQDQPDLEQMVKWKDTLERCDVPFKLQQLLCLLTNNTFSRLTWLSMEMDPFVVPDEPTNWNSFDCLKNVPLLNDLRLARGVITFDALEKIHSVCPQLKSLTLSHMWFLTPSNDTLPPPISPATPLLSLTIGADTHIEGVSCTLLDYIIAKYTQLVDLELLSRWIGVNERKHEDVAFHENNHYDAHNLQYYIRGDGFLSHLPSSIKKLRVNNRLFFDPIAALEKTRINPTELMFYVYNGDDIFLAEVIREQNHIDYIKCLDQLKTLGAGFRYDDYDTNDSMVFENITHLTAMMLDDHQCYEAKIDQLFLTYPSLKSLTIHQGTHHLTTSCPYERKMYPSLRKLSIKSLDLDEKALNFICTALPNIKQLDLPISGERHTNGHVWGFYQDSECGCVDDDDDDDNEWGCLFNRDLSINLSGCSLDDFTLSITRIEEFKRFNTLLYLEIQTQKGLKKYTVTRKSGYGYHARSTTTDEIIQGSNVVKVTCDSIKKFMIRSEDVKLSLFDV